MRASIPFVHQPTAATGAATLPGIDQDQRHPGALRFVGETVAQVTEAPIVLPMALALANRHPVADPGQVFQDHRGLRVFGILDEAFRQTVIGPALKARLAASQFLQTPFGTLCASRLIGLLMGRTAAPDPLDDLRQRP